MRYLTWKKAFLVLWGTACRRSELHALDFQTFARSANWSRVELYLMPKVMAKYQFLDKDPSASRAYTLYRLDAPSSEDALCCPVRALRFYLDRTRKI